MLPERILLEYPIEASPDSPTVEQQIRSLIDREFLAETNYFSKLEDWLKDITLDRMCGRIVGPERSGKSVASQHWVDEISGRRGDLLPLPLRIHMIDCPPSCDARKLCNLISSSLGRGTKNGKPQDFTLRALDALKLLKVDTLLIDNARCLTENAFRALIRIYRHRYRNDEYRLSSIILIGSTELDAWLKHIGKFNYFKPFYRFYNLSSAEFSGVIKTFERRFLGLPNSVELIDADSVSALYSKTNGNIEDFTEILIQVIRRSSSENALYFDSQVFSQVLESYGDIHKEEE